MNELEQRDKWLKRLYDIRANVDTWDQFVRMCADMLAFYQVRCNEWREAVHDLIRKPKDHEQAPDVDVIDFSTMTPEERAVVQRQCDHEWDVRRTEEHTYRFCPKCKKQEK